MKFVYKINSSYDGFTPARLPDRLHGHSLTLGWKRYVDSVDLGDEIWVYFRGPHRFTDGVYAQGIVEDVDYEAKTVILRVVEHSTTSPLTDHQTSERLAAVVATPYRQVFFLPEEIVTAPACTLAGAADSCAARRCGSCPTWKNLPTVDLRNLVVPHRLRGHVDSYAPGYWTVPSRSYLFRRGRTIRPGVRKSSDLFYRFKTGDAAVAFPLALGTHRVLAKARRLDFDAVVPVPLSPDKEKAGELHRTKVLAGELARLLDAPERSWLRLSRPVSKKRLRVQHGLTAASFEGRYREALETAGRPAGAVLLVDDVCTEGSTLRTCADALREHGADVVVAATAGQMAVKAALRRPEALWVSA